MKTRGQGSSVDRRSEDRNVTCSKPASGAASELWQNVSIPHCLCLSDETLKAVGSFDLVSIAGEINDHTQGVNM